MDKFKTGYGKKTRKNEEKRKTKKRIKTGYGKKTDKISLPKAIRRRQANDKAN
jgi:hypothetical protein